VCLQQQPQLDRAEGTTATLARDGEGSLKISPPSASVAGGGGSLAEGSIASPGGAGASQSGASASINKKLLQKRQCTEAMLAVSLRAVQNEASSIGQQLFFYAACPGSLGKSWGCDLQDFCWSLTSALCSLGYAIQVNFGGLVWP
jgi:hypothetical protein